MSNGTPSSPGTGFDAQRPLAVDLCCKAGGVSEGLYRAGFRVIGVDIEPQPRYPFEFIQADALKIPLRDFGADFFWASPHCQGYTELRHAPGTKGKPQQIQQFRARMPANTLWAIENVEDAAWDMDNPITLCGSMFGLGAQGCRLQRHRLIMANFPIDPPPCSHDGRPVIGVYGGHARRRAASAGGRGTRDQWDGGHKAAASEALGIDWMTLGELSEAIPPAYSEFVGRAAMAIILQTKLAEAAE
jgi:DNA (cytosine-5)-methyltransferase 1